MRILTLTLENFRGIKNLEIDFQGKNTTIYGANGTGKTTIANAVSWLLFGKAATGEKDFDPKTVGKHNLHHSASAKFQKDDGKIVTLKKDFYEVWTKKKGSSVKTFTRNTTDFWIDDIPSRESVYNKSVQQLCGGTLEAAKILTMYNYFSEVMSMEDRRKILFDVCGDVSDKDVIKSDKKLEELNSFLSVPGTSGQMYSIDDYKKMASERRKNINHELEMIPARIDEASKSITDLPNEEEVKKAIADLQVKAEAIEMSINASNTNALAQEISSHKTLLESHRATFEAQQNTKYAAKYKKLQEANNSYSNLCVSMHRNQIGLKVLIDSYEATMRKRDSLIKDFSEIQSRQWDHGQEACPTCGQTLPSDKVQELREEFNLKKSRQLEDINTRGQACSQAVIKQLKNKIDKLTSQIESERLASEEAKKQVDSLQKAIDSRPSYEDTDDYKAITEKISILEQSDESDGNQNIISKKRQEKEEIMAAIRVKNAELAAIDVAKKSRKRIAELEKQQRDDGDVLEHLEKGLYLCDEFTRTKVGMVTDNINSRFHYVHFKLFEDQINGGVRERCEPMVQNADGEWVDYRSANTAAQVNAGLDIIGVLSDYYEIHLPVFIDRAESVTQIINAADLQMIRLVVSADDGVLRIENN